ncbi:lipopolysaccharide biosynthesis protein, partial [Myxococcota bacterium]
VCTPIARRSEPKGFPDASDVPCQQPRPHFSAWRRSLDLEGALRVRCHVFARSTAMSVSAESSRPQPGNGEVARSAGRGGLAVGGAKLYFIGIGAVQQVLLPWALGLGPYGALSSVLAAAAIVYNPVVTASLQGVSRAVSQASPETEPSALRTTFTVHSVLALLLGALFAGLASSMGAVLNAPHLVQSLRIAGGVIFLYGLYASLIGALNGRRKFTRQAGFDVVFGTLRTVLLAAGGYWMGRNFGLGVEGAMLGFVLAVALILGAAMGLVGIGRRGQSSVKPMEHLAFVAPLLVGQTLLNLLLQADLTLLRGFASGAALRAHLSPQAADPLVAAYRMTQLFSFLPYQLLLSVTFILFPLLAKAHHAGDRDAVARYVRTGVRVALIIAGAMVSVSSGLAGPLFRLLFPAEAAELGTRPMQLLTLGFGAFALFGILTTVLNSLGRERASAVITALAFALVASLCWVLLSDAPFGAELLWRTAISTTTGLVTATTAAAWLVYRTARAVVAPLCFLRVGVALVLAITVGRVLPCATRLATVGCAATVALLYGALLVAMREIGRPDVELIRTVIKRRPS